MTRIQLIEAPYLDEYISWYLALGFNRVYFLNTEPVNEQAIKEFIQPGLLNKVTFVNHACPTNSFGYLRKMFTNTVKEDYILHADSDEYLMLPKSFTNISQLVEKHSYDKYLFRWVDIPVDSLYETSMTEYLLSDKATGRYCATQKMMVRRKAWLSDPRASCDPHAFKCAGSKKVFQDSASSGATPFYIHFLLRGYLHTAIKVLEQRLPTERGKTPKAIIKNFMTGEIPLGKYPFRFLSASGEYCISTQIYLQHKGKWNIPAVSVPDRRQQTTELYSRVLKKYGLPVTNDLLNVDTFGLQEKISKCNKIVDEKYKKFLSGQMPSRIGNYLTRVFRKM